MLGAVERGCIIIMGGTGGGGANIGIGGADQLVSPVARLAKYVCPLTGSFAASHPGGSCGTVAGCC